MKRLLITLGLGLLLLDGCAPKTTEVYNSDFVILKILIKNQLQ